MCACMCGCVWCVYQLANSSVKIEKGRKTQLFARQLELLGLEGGQKCNNQKKINK